MAKKIMFILRGLPGSGKSGFATKIQEHFKGYVALCSADNFFYKKFEDPPGYKTVGAPQFEYQFNPALLGQAHNTCFRNAFHACRDGMPIVVIDNTNSQGWEYLNYELLAVQFGYELVIYETGIACTDFTPDHPRSRKIYSVVGKDHLKEWVDRQQHNVPLDAILKMWWRWEIDQRAHVLTSQDTDPKCPLNVGLKVEDLDR